MSRERLDRAVERARLVVGDERERRPPRLAVHVEPHVGRDRDEARVRLGVVADVLGDHGEAVQASGALARDRDLRRIAVLGDVRGRVGGRRRRRSRSPTASRRAACGTGRARPDASARRASLRAGPLPAPTRKWRIGQHGLAGDRERRVVEEVVRLGDRAGERALDRQDAERRSCRSAVACGDRGEARQRNELDAVAGRGGRTQPRCGRRRVRGSRRSWLSWCVRASVLPEEFEGIRLDSRASRRRRRAERRLARKDARGKAEEEQLRACARHRVHRLGASSRVVNARRNA